MSLENRRHSPHDLTLKGFWPMHYKKGEYVMLLQEFESLTGFYPDIDMFEVIHEEYMSSPDNKEEWCRKYIRNTDGIATKIQREVNTRKMTAENPAKKRVAELEKKIDQLEREAEKQKERIRLLEGWTPYQVSRMSTVAYAELCGCITDYGHVLDDDRFRDHEAVKTWIFRHFGFPSALVRIEESIPKFEKSREGYIRKIKEPENRPPAYFSQDYNYVRFNVVASDSVYQWEVVNGGLYPYND